jgi:hypothetical protein
MIPFLSRYLQQLHFERVYWLTRAERRRAFWLLTGVALCIAALALIWLRH